MPTIIPRPLSERQSLAARVQPGAYYTDGARLFEVVEIHPVGCVTFQDSRSSDVRCLGIDSFRERLWRVR